MTPQCEFCARPKDYGHHYTGRDGGEQDAYLDPEFVIDLCHDHHYFVHDDLFTTGLDDEHTEGPLTFFDRVEMRLRRAAVAFARLAHALPGQGLWGVLALVFTKWADDIAEGMHVLDERYPDWRGDAGFFPD